MTAVARVFPVICPSGERPVPAWRPLAGLIRSLSACERVTRHSSAARGFHPQTDTGSCPPTFRLEVGERMLADQLDYVVGVDPHRDSHALAVVDVVSGAVVVEASVAASSDGYACVLELAEQHASGRRAFAIEGTGSFGRGLTSFLRGQGQR